MNNSSRDYSSISSSYCSKKAVRIHILNKIPTNNHQQQTIDGDEQHSNDIDVVYNTNIQQQNGKRTNKKKKKGRRRYINDEHATVYIDIPSSFTTSNNNLQQIDDYQFEIGNVYRLIRNIGHNNCNTVNGGNGINNCEEEVQPLLWVPVVLRRFPTSKHQTSSTTTNCKEEGEQLRPNLYIPPCTAATLGLHTFHTQHYKNVHSMVYLQPIEAVDICKASHATLKEIGCPTPEPNLVWPVNEEEGDTAQDDGGKNASKDNGTAFSRLESTDVPTNTKEDIQLRKFFLYPPPPKEDDDEQHIHLKYRKNNKIPKSKPRQRLLTLGSIFAVPSYYNCDINNSNMNDNRESGRGVIKNVRYYQVVDIQSSRTDDDISKSKTSWKDSMAYIVSPMTNLVLLPSTTTDDESNLHPQLNETVMARHTWRIPRPSLVISFLQSVPDKHMNGDESVISTDSGSVQTTTEHPSTNDLVDALYLQGVVPAQPSTSKQNCQVCDQVYNNKFASAAAVNSDNNPRIIHIIGKEENHIQECINESSDIMSMRSFHVNGLASFWAHYNLFNTYSSALSKQQQRSSPPATLTGGLSDKLRGLSAALKVAKLSSPCVLHIASIDDELSPTEGHAADVDARKEEERRMLEVIREATCPVSPSSSSRVELSSSHTTTEEDGAHIIQQDLFLSQSTTPKVIVILSTSKALPPGPISSSLLQSSIEISPPDINYARILWDNNEDGTFDMLSSYLVGKSANDIRYLRENFIPRLKEKLVTTAKGGDSSFDAITIIKSLLPGLETVHSFTQSTSNGGGSSNLPLSSSSLPNVRWEDIGGLESIRKEIMDAVELPLKYPNLFKGSRRSGILLFGPPGTGKTLVAKAVARECGLPFLSIKGPELLGSYVGESEANIRAVFDAARLAAVDSQSSSTSLVDGDGGYGGASVLFFDELDSLAPRRGETGHGDGVMDRVVATLLGELDGGGSSRSIGKHSQSANVIVIGATNRPDLLDPSLLRPGRFDRLLYLGPAKTKEHCLKILLAQTRKFKFEQGLDASTVLEQAMESFPPTLSGADLSAVASGALMQGLKRICQQIEEEVLSINSEKGVENNSELAVDIDDVMASWSKEQLQPTMTVNDFVEAAKEIVPSISPQDLESFEKLQRQFSSGQYS